MKTQLDFDIIIIGGGIVGLCCAYKIQQHHPHISIAVLEKEDRVAVHQTGHNSGVIHSGLYYKPGSNKAKTCASGRSELINFAKEYNIPFKICGKIIVATSKKELDKLQYIYHNGQANQIEGISQIGPERIKQLEPDCNGIAGIHVPCTGIIDFTKVANKLAELIEEKGRGKVLTSCEVKAFEKHDFYTKLITNNKTLTARHIINCAGLWSDKIAQMDRLQSGLKIVPFRGDYCELTGEGKKKVRHLIYPVPDPAFPFLGVHFTRTIDNIVECGPSAVFSFKREGYSKTDFSLPDSWNSLTFTGTWKLFIKYWKLGLIEYAKAFSKKLFVRKIQKLIPSLQADQIKPGKSGVRAQAVARNGKLIDDFHIEKTANSIHVLNSPSPAATAALAIGEYVNDIATEHFQLKK